MERLKKPSNDGYRQLIAACANSYSQVQTQDRKQRILSSLDQLETIATKYDEFAKLGSLETIEPHTHCGDAEKDDLITLYNTKFVPEGSPGRNIYLTIRQSAPRGRCPLCSQLPVSTLDHYLPKSKYPAFSVYPCNLVPACTRCNGYKLAKADALTLHPYYDNIKEICWLKCILQLNEEAISVTFGIWDDVKPITLRQRMVNHLEHLGVAELYQSSAVSHLADIRYRLCELGYVGGPAAVYAYLQEELESRRVYDLNSWGTALYSAMCTENWFIQGGYIQIEN